MTTTCELAYSIYNIAFDGDTIVTTFTRHTSIVDKWIQEVETAHRHRLHKLIVGLDTEWLPNTIPYQKRNPIAILQLCVGRRCLIFQLIHADEIPKSLRDFLNNEKYTFVGVEIERDVEYLEDDYDLEVCNARDLRDFAAECLNKTDLRRAGLQNLAREVLGKEVEKWKEVSRSEWDKVRLCDAQVKYACIDAFISFKIGRFLQLRSSNFVMDFVRSVLQFGECLVVFIFLFGFVKRLLFGFGNELQ